MKKFVQICPKCGSTNINLISNPSSIITGLNNTSHCEDCNYGYPIGINFPEVDIDQIENFREELKKT